MKIDRSWWLSLVLAGSVGCSSAAPAVPVGKPAPPTASESSGSSGSAVRLQRSICFGRCPAYAVTLHEDGRVDFAGELHVVVNGSATGQADVAGTAALFSRLRGPEFRSLKEQYTPGDKSCGQYSTDMPSVKMDITLDGKTRHYNHYTGCSAVPPLLTEIEQQVDRVSDSHRWIAGEDVR